MNKIKTVVVFLLFVAVLGKASANDKQCNFTVTQDTKNIYVANGKVVDVCLPGTARIKTMSMGEHTGWDVESEFDKFMIRSPYSPGGSSAVSTTNMIIWTDEKPSKRYELEFTVTHGKDSVASK